MKEEERLSRINNIKIAEERIWVLEGKMVELNRLKSKRHVKRFLELSQELQELPNCKQLIKEAFHIDPKECTHGFWFCMGERVLHFAGIAAYSYYNTFDEKDEDCYIYRCLDCGEEVFVPKNEINEFLQHESVKPIIGKIDYIECQKLYRELLLTNSVEETYQKLLKIVQ